MMADSVDESSRSLKEHTEENIRALVDKIIDGQIADGLMRNAPLTFKDVETVKKVFVEKLKIMSHTRISYPVAQRKHPPAERGPARNLPLHYSTDRGHGHTACSGNIPSSDVSFPRIPNPGLSV